MHSNEREERVALSMAKRKLAFGCCCSERLSANSPTAFLTIDAVEDVLRAVSSYAVDDLEAFDMDESSKWLLAETQQSLNRVAPPGSSMTCIIRESKKSLELLDAASGGFLLGSRKPGLLSSPRVGFEISRREDDIACRRKLPQYRCRLGCILVIWVAFFSRRQRYCC